MDYKTKYLKYKLKYLNAKKIYGGMEEDTDDDEPMENDADDEPMEEDIVQIDIDNFLKNKNKETIKTNFKENKELYIKYFKKLISGHLKGDDITFMERKLLIHVLFLPGHYYLLDIFANENANENIKILFDLFINEYLENLKIYTYSGRNLHEFEFEEELLNHLFIFIFDNVKHLSKEQRDEFYSHKTIEVIIYLIKEMWYSEKTNILIDLLEKFDRELSKQEYQVLDAPIIVEAIQEHIANIDDWPLDYASTKINKSFLESKLVYWNYKTPSKPRASSVMTKNTVKRFNYPLDPSNPFT